jgi:hypothetical protein
MNTNKPLFNLGQTVATPGALDALQTAGVSPITLLVRHQCGDWGDLETEDKRANDQALKHGSRLLSAYLLGTVKLWVITESDRSVTTILLPSEY